MNTADQEAYERYLADELIRRDFYDRLHAFASALQAAFTSQDWVPILPWTTEQSSRLMWCGLTTLFTVR